MTELEQRIDRRLQRWTPELIDSLRHRGDELADRTIRVIFEQHDIDQVDRILGNLIQNDQIEFARESQGLSPLAARALNIYLQEAEALPVWADPVVIQEGEEVYRDHGLAGFSVLGCASLPESYATLYGSKVLGATQQLKKHVRRRLYETSQFVIDVMSAGGLSPNGAGIATTLKVRLMHAAIRRLILFEEPPGVAHRRPQSLGEVYKYMPWSEEKLGQPVHQVAMSMAILSFSYITLRSFRKLGIELRPRQERAYLHCWNVIGHVMGVEEDLLLSRPETMLEAEYLYNRIWPAAIEETEEGRALEKTLLSYLASFVPPYLVAFRHLPQILTRFLVSDRIARVLGIDLDYGETAGLELLKGFTTLHRAGRELVDAAGVNLTAADRAGSWLMLLLTGLPHLQGESLGQLPPTRVAAELLFRWMATGLQNKQRGDDRHPFKIPTELAKDRWRLAR